MTATSASALLAVLFENLQADEQEEAFALITELRLRRLAGTDGEIARFINGLVLVQQQVVGELSVDDYREWQPKLKAQGRDVPPLSQVTKFFGTWRLAKEALSLSENETPLKIEARFRSRRVGKVHRYRDETLRETLLACSEFLGYPPLVAEFEAWRYRELELAKARGEEISLPSASPYRSRFGGWEKALLHYGFSQEDIDGAHEAGLERSIAATKRYRFA